MMEIAFIAVCLLTGLGVFFLLFMSALDDYIELCQEEKRRRKRAMLRRMMHSS